MKFFSFSSIILLSTLLISCSSLHASFFELPKNPKYDCAWSEKYARGDAWYRKCAQMVTVHTIDQTNAQPRTLSISMKAIESHQRIMPQKCAIMRPYNEVDELPQVKLLKILAVKKKCPAPSFSPHPILLRPSAKQKELEK